MCTSESRSKSSEYWSFMNTLNSDTLRFHILFLPVYVVGARMILDAARIFDNKIQMNV